MSQSFKTTVAYTLIHKNFDPRLNNYLSDLNLINKYFLLDKKEISSLEKVSIEFPIPGSFSTNDKDKYQFDSESQIKFSFILYLLTVNLPFFAAKHWKVSKNKYSSQTLKISLSEIGSIETFLIRIFFEQKTLLKFNVKSFIQNYQDSSKQNFLFLTETSVDLKAFENKNLFLHRFKNLNIKINFCFKYVYSAYQVCNPKKINAVRSLFLHSRIRV